MIKTKCSTILFGENPEKRQCFLPSLVTGNTPQWYRPYYRLKWADILDSSLEACNLSFTLNADRRCDFDVYDRKVSNKVLFETLNHLKSKGVLQKITAVYEYGTKEDKKLHYHGIVKVTDREKFENEILKVFNRNLAVKHRTLHTKLLRTVRDRSRYIKYMKKDKHNKEKCLISL